LLTRFLRKNYNVSMQNPLIKWVINTIAIIVSVKIVPGITYVGGWLGILVVGVIFGLINTFIRPFINLFSIPLLILSLGLFTLVINALMLSLTSWISAGLNLGFHVAGFKAAFIGSLVISLVSLVLSCLLPSEEPLR
jgi:putative membrane protein